LRLLIAWCLCGILLPGVSASQSQTIRVQRLSQESGLSNNVVGSIMQDKDGFIWLATRDGLNRYDGFNFKVYRPRLNDCRSYSQHVFNDAHIDRSGLMWVDAACGLHQYDLTTNSIVATHNYNPQSELGLSHQKVQSIFEDRQGQIWIGSNYGINKFIRSTSTFEHLVPYPSAEPGAGENIVLPMAKDHQGNLWVGSYSGGLSKYDALSQTFSHFRHNPNDSRSLASDSIIALLVDRSGTLWVGTRMGLQRFDSRTHSFDHFRHDPADTSSLSDNGVTEIHEDRTGTLWVGTFHGLNRFNRDTETFDRFHQNPDDLYSPGGDIVSFIFEDRAGYLWIATQGAGVSRFNPRMQGFAYYNRNDATPNGLEESRIQATYEDRQGRLWIGTSRGLHKYDPTTESFRVFHHNRADGAYDARRDNILSIHEDRAGTLWIGSRIGLSSFDRDSGTFNDLQSSQKINEFAANVVFEDSAGALWIGTGKGPLQFDRERQRFIDVGNNPTLPINTALSSVWIYFIHEDRNGDVWFGTDAGLSQYHQEEKYFTHRGHNYVLPDNPESMSSDVVLSMYEDAEGVLWIGTNNGLNKQTMMPHPRRADLKIPSFITYGSEHGIRGAAIVGILGDENGFLWLSTDNGLARFDPVSETAISFDVMDGLQGNEFSTGSHVRTRDGRMYFGGTNGLTAFYPQQVQYVHNEETAPVVLTDLLFANNPVEIGGTINHSDELALNDINTMFSIEFAALTFGVPDATQYAYRLMGFNSDWVITDNSNRRANFSGLRPGDYVFQVTRVDDTGIREAEAASLRVSILPPFWMTWWAYAIYVFAAALLFALLVRARTLALTRRSQLLESKVVARTRQIDQNERLIRHQADHLEELLHVKERLFANISHEFRTPLTLILGPIERMRRKAQDSDTRAQLTMVKENSQRLLRLVDQLLGLSRLSAEKPVTKSPQPLLPIATTIVKSFQPLADEKHIQLDVVNGEKLWVSCASDALEKILLNLVSNAIKYTPEGGWVNVRIASAASDIVRLSVSDSGIGINPQDREAVFERFYRAKSNGNGTDTIQGAGLGLALVKELAEAYGGSIELDSRVGLGTTVSVLLPRHRVRPVDRESNVCISDTNLIPLEIAASTPTDGAASPSTDGGSNGQSSLLVIEDNVGMQEYLVSLFSDNFDCSVAANGEDGLRIAAEIVPDAIICDVMLPNMDGFDVSKTLKTQQTTSHIPIVMLTGRGDHDSRIKGLRKHVDDYLTKPFNDEELVLRIENLLSARDTLKRRYSRQLFDGSSANGNLNRKEQRFIDKLQAAIDTRFSDPEFRVDQLATAMAMSGRQLQRKLKALVDKSPAEFLRSYRLTIAKKKLSEGTQVGLVAEAVGFSSHTYFASCFKAEFGATPSEFQHSRS